MSSSLKEHLIGVARLLPRPGSTWAPGQQRKLDESAVFMWHRAESARSATRYGSFFLGKKNLDVPYHADNKGAMV